VPGVQPREPRFFSPALDAVRSQLEPVLAGYLRDRRAELATMDPSAATLAEELVRLVRAGGKRLRPALAYWSHRAAGGEPGEPILRAGVALELLHTAAIVHDDLMDRSETRRGVPATHVRFAKEAPVGADPDAFGTAAAVLVGDLALVLSDRALRTSGFGQGELARASIWFDRMRVQMAAGQFLDVSGANDRGRVSSLKSSSYTTEGPILLGAALAGSDPGTEGSLLAFGRLVGQAFQLRDDVLDGEAPAGTHDEIDGILDRAERALDGARLDAEAVDALVELSALLRLRGSG
jgi:geranylgeranyl diphosphate synthase type I